MWCLACDRNLAECICPDLAERLSACPNVIFSEAVKQRAKQNIGKAASHDDRGGVQYRVPGVPTAEEQNELDENLGPIPGFSLPTQTQP